jgi:putative membrane protein
MRIPLRLALLGSVALGLGAVQAQTATTPATPATPATPSTGMTDTRNPGDRSTLVEASALEAGANSFTEGQARSRLEDAGFTAIEGLAKDDQGFWRGRAMRGGQVEEVAMDFRGRIAAGPNLAALGSAVTRGSGTTTVAPATGTTTPGTTMGTTTGTTTGRPDGTPGNPPSTAVGRGVDALQGQPSRPDGTPGNPPGTAAGRAMDRATGTNPPVAAPPGTTPPASR